MVCDESYASAFSKFAGNLEGQRQNCILTCLGFKISINSGTCELYEQSFWEIQH